MGGRNSTAPARPTHITAENADSEYPGLEQEVVQGLWRLESLRVIGSSLFLQVQMADRKLKKQDQTKGQDPKKSFWGKLEPLWRIRVMLAIWSVWLCIYLDWIPGKCNEDILCQLVMQRMLETPLAIIVVYIMAGYLQVASVVLQHFAWTLMVMTWPQWLLGLLIPEERSVKQYVDMYGAVKKHKTRSGGKIIICTKYGVHLWRGFIQVVINAHKHNKSWGGTFTMQDLRLSGHRCRITREATCAGTYRNLKLDLATLADLLICHFKKKDQPIPYIKDLHRVMKKPGCLSSPAPTEEQLLKFLEDHPALCTSRRRIILILDLFQAYEGMSIEEKRRFDIAVDKVTVGNWVEATKHANNAVLMRVLTYRKYDPTNTEAVYASTAKDLFRFLRNFQTHGGDRKANGEQPMRNMEDLEYVAAYVFSSFISDLIYQLVAEMNMDGMLQYAWKNYRKDKHF